MGKGGEAATTANAVKKPYLLEKLSTEELRKWAVAYGVNAKSEADRDFLLRELVSSRVVWW